LLTQRNALTRYVRDGEQMNASKVELAAQNNSIWCDSICRAHGVPGEFFPEAWLNRAPVPPYYSNLVVLSAVQGAALKHIRALMKLPLPANWSVKDSFCSLGLAPLGFEVLFEASWIWRGLTSSYPGSPSTNIRWSRISASLELANWEAAWSDDSRNREAVGRQTKFPASLLPDPDLAFFAGAEESEIVAGGIANRTGAVVGLSNFFVKRGDAGMLWKGLIRSTLDVFPGLPLVGYERGRDLEVALACGFQSIGSLRVWIQRV
jgi:hypothetical protein